MRASFEQIIEDIHDELNRSFLPGAVEVYLTQLGDSLSIDKVSVSVRRKNNGTDAMKIILQVCDRFNINVCLIPHSLDQNSMDREALIDWYKKFGFVLDASNNVMSRGKAEI